MSAASSVFLQRAGGQREPRYHRINHMNTINMITTHLDRVFLFVDVVPKAHYMTFEIVVKLLTRLVSLL